MFQLRTDRALSLSLSLSSKADVYCCRKVGKELCMEVNFISYFFVSLSLSHSSSANHVSTSISSFQSCTMHGSKKMEHDEEISRAQKKYFAKVEKRKSK
jgi:hypothetical protein